MFSDRFWFWKFSLTLLIVAGLCHYGLREGRRAYPEIWDFMVDPEGHAGRRIWLPLSEVRAIHDDGCDLYDPGNDKIFRITSPLPPDIVVGDRLEAVGIFHADRTVTLLPGGIRRLPAHRLSRRFMMAVSLAALAWLAWRVSRRYRWSGQAPAPLIFRG